MRVMFKPVLLYSVEGDFVGYGIMGERKLQSTNVWGADEQEQLTTRLRELNEGEIVKKFWPKANDPEVLALLDDDTFEPIQYEIVPAIDFDKSHIIYKEGEIEDNFAGYGDIDFALSQIVYKEVKSPVDEAAGRMRMHRAMEAVAKRRAQA